MDIAKAGPGERAGGDMAALVQSVLGAVEGLRSEMKRGPAEVTPRLTVEPPSVAPPWLTAEVNQTPELGPLPPVDPAQYLWGELQRLKERQARVEAHQRALAMQIGNLANRVNSAFGAGGVQKL